MEKIKNGSLPPRFARGRLTCFLATTGDTIYVLIYKRNYQTRQAGIADESAFNIARLPVKSKPGTSPPRLCRIMATTAMSQNRGAGLKTFAFAIVIM
ncbi:MAG: hypothetical protein LBH14_07660 [Desulfobulbaceae bacterium]|nr:hypothetical protein [Desulfobulbaceae bacterium]